MKIINPFLCQQGFNGISKLMTIQYTGADPGFQVRGGAHLKYLRRAEGGAKIFGVFRVKNHDFMPKNHIFSNFRGSRAGCAPPDIYICLKSNPNIVRIRILRRHIFCSPLMGFNLTPLIHYSTNRLALCLVPMTILCSMI
jgi:hypothetical protein